MQDEQKPGWTFTAEQQTASSPETQTQNTVLKAEPAVSWTASEFIEHSKTAVWYVVFGFVAAVIITAIYFVTRDILSIISLSIMAIVFMVLAARKPRTLQYRLSDKGIQAGEKFYGMNQFKSFSVIQEGPIRSISLLPLKRFMPSFTIYFSPEDEDKIVNFLSQHLAYEERKQDPVDRLMRSIRF